MQTAVKNLASKFLVVMEIYITVQIEFYVVDVQFHSISRLCIVSDIAMVSWYCTGWLGGVLVRVLDLWSRDCEFGSWPVHCRVA